MPKRTFQPKTRHRAKMHGWRGRLKRAAHIIKSRRLKGRHRLSA